MAIINSIYGNPVSSLQVIGEGYESNDAGLGTVIITTPLIEDVNGTDKFYLGAYLAYDLEATSNPYTPFSANTQRKLLDLNICTITGICEVGYDGILGRIYIDVNKNTATLYKTTGGKFTSSDLPTYPYLQALSVRIDTSLSNAKPTDVVSGSWEA